MRAMLEELVTLGLLPADCEVLSTHNNLVVASRSRQIVVRVARLSSINERLDPGDLRYAHQIAWRVGEAGSVLSPIAEAYELHGDFVLSTFPLMEVVRWRTQDAQSVAQAIVAFGYSLSTLDGCMNLRHLDIEGYSRDRLEHASTSLTIDKEVISWATRVLDHYGQHYALNELTRLDSALVHGDLHEGNVVNGDEGAILFIDLDSAAVGPRLYDLASWRVREELGDAAPIGMAVKLARESEAWDEEAYRALVGWKLLSSVSHVIRYGDSAEIFRRIRTLDVCGSSLDAPGPWGTFGGQG